MTTYPHPTDPVSAITRADGTTEAHSTDHGRVIGIWENPKHHGARGTGTDNDYQVIQDLLDSMDNPEGGLIRFPAGQYLNATASWVVKPGTVIEGSGSDTIFIHDVPGGDPLFRLDGPDNSQGTVFRKFRINGPDVRHAPFVYGTGTGHGIHLNGTGATGLVHTRIEDVFFEGVGDATHWCVYATWALETHIARIKVVAAGGGGVYFGDTSNASVVRDSTMSNNGDGAIGAVYVGADGVLVEGNVFEAWRGLYGVKVASGMVGWNLIRNWHEDNDGYNLWLDGSSVPLNGVGNGNVIGCNISRNGSGYGLYAESVHDTNIIGCGFSESLLKSSAVANMGLRLNIVNTTFTSLDVTGLVHNDDRYLVSGASVIPGKDGIYLYKGGNVSQDKGYHELGEITTPSTPAANYLRTYAADANGVTRPHYLDPSGVEWRSTIEHTPALLTDAATVAIDCSRSNNFYHTCSASRTMGAPTNMTDGQRITFLINVTGGSPITPTWNAVYSVGGTFTVADGKRRSITFIYWALSSAWHEVARTADA